MACRHVASRVEVHRPVRLVRAPTRDERLDERHALRNVLRHARDAVKRAYAKRRHVVKEETFVVPCVVHEHRLIRHGVTELRVELIHDRVARRVEQRVARRVRALSSRRRGGSSRRCKLLLRLARLEFLLLDGCFLLRRLAPTGGRWKRFTELLEFFVRLVAHICRRRHGIVAYAVDVPSHGLAVVLEQLVSPRSQNDLVVNVRDVHLEQDVVVKVVLHDSAQNVKRKVRTRMSHVCDVVDGRSARVPRDGVP